MPAGTSRWRAIQRGVMRAATVIGMTATSGTKPASGATRSRTFQRANSARRPVTNRYRGRSAMVVPIPLMFGPASSPGLGCCLLEFDASDQSGFADRPR